MNEKKNPLQDRLPVGRSAGVGDFAAERHSAVPARSGFGVCDSRHHRNAGRNRKPPARKERSVAGSPVAIGTGLMCVLTFAVENAAK